MLIAEVLRIKGHDVARIGRDEAVSEAVRRLSQQRIGALVVEDPWMKLVGIFSERDLLHALAQRGAAALACKVSELMTSHVVTCASAERVDAALSMMTMKRIRHLPVVDDGHLTGIVSIGDLVKHRMDEKEREASVLLDIARLRT